MKFIIDSLHSVPWSAIKGNFSDCSHIPEAIINLTSSNFVTCKSGYNQIDNHLIVQGGLSEGAFYILPFLIEIALSDLAGRELAIDLLAEIISGTASWDNFVKFRTMAMPFQMYIPDENGMVVPLIVAIRLAIGSQLSMFIPLVNSNSESMRQNSQLIIESFPEYGFAIFDHLRKVRLKSNDAVAKEILDLIIRMQRQEM